MLLLAQKQPLFTNVQSSTFCIRKKVFITASNHSFWCNGSMHQARNGLILLQCYLKSSNKYKKGVKPQDTQCSRCSFRFKVCQRHRYKFKSSQTCWMLMHCAENVPIIVLTLDWEPVCVNQNRTNPMTQLRFSVHQPSALSIRILTNHTTMGSQASSRWEWTSCDTACGMWHTVISLHNSGLFHRAYELVDTSARHGTPHNAGEKPPTSRYTGCRWPTA